MTHTKFLARSMFCHTLNLFCKNAPPPPPKKPFADDALGDAR